MRVARGLIRYGGGSTRVTGVTMAAMKGRVLIVDDDTALAEMLGIVLRGEGFEPCLLRRRRPALGRVPRAADPTWCCST